MGLTPLSCSPLRQACLRPCHFEPQLTGFSCYRLLFSSEKADVASLPTLC